MIGNVGSGLGIQTLGGGWAPATPNPQAAMGVLSGMCNALKGCPLQDWRLALQGFQQGELSASQQGGAPRLPTPLTPEQQLLEKSPFYRLGQSSGSQYYTDMNPGIMYEC